MQCQPMTRRFQCLAMLAALLVSAAETSAQSVWTVDNAPCALADFTAIQPAVDAAADGDVIWVHDGAGSAFPPFVMDGRALTIVVGDGGATTNGPVSILNLGDGQSARLRGFGKLRGLLVQDCDGPVWIEDTASVAFTAMPHAQLVDSAAVSFHRCRLGTDSSKGGRAGLDASGSWAALLDCKVNGQKGAFSSAYIGGPGISLSDASTLVAAGSVARGGIGGVIIDSAGYGTARPGGAGLLLADASSSAWSYRSKLQGGTGGEGGENGPGPNGPATSVAAGATFGSVAGIPRRFSMQPAAVRERESVTLEIGAQPGDMVLLLVGTQLAPHHAPSFDGVTLLGAPWAESSLGFFAAADSLSVSVPDGLVDPGGAAVLFAQALHFGADGASSTSGSMLVVLDEGFAGASGCN